MKGILFKPDLIKAIAENRKTQTRRVIKPQPEHVLIQNAAGDWRYMDREGIAPNSPTWKPPYKVGETVYIKESFQVCDMVYDEYAGGWEAGYPLTVVPTVKPAYQVMATYKLDGIDDGPWRSPILMPAWAARYFIVITEVKAQRVQEITEEGTNREGNPYPGMGGKGALPGVWWYRDLWDSLNPKHPWGSNPWVWAITFRLLEVNHANP